MDINVTALFYADTWAFSGSRATHGANVGPLTWAASKDEAAASPILTTAEQLDALRDHCRGFGAWEKAEIDAWSAVECNAMLVQMVAGDKREMGLDEAIEGEDGELWDGIADDMAEGRIPSNLFKSGDAVFYTLSD